MTPMRKINPLMKLINYLFIDLPTLFNIFVWWNFGLFFGACLIF